MKTTRNLLFALALLGGTAGAASARVVVEAGVNAGPGRAAVDFGVFYDNLAPYGNWVQRANYGWVWTPRDVASTWRPYQAGHWVWSDEGWTWLSDEPYGWATYHYGRWYQDPELGWSWVPGTDWAPAWVSWQEGQNYVGWAPLPPGANVTQNAAYNGPDQNAYPQGPPQGGYDQSMPPVGYDDSGYDNGYDTEGDYAQEPVYAPTYGGGYGGYGVYGGGYGYDSYAFGIAPAAYLFVPAQYFLATSLFDYFVPWGGVWGYTRNCTYYGWNHGFYFNRGVSFDRIAHFYHGRIPRYEIGDGRYGRGGFGHHVDGNRISFYRPQVHGGRGGSPLDRPGARGSVIGANEFHAQHPNRPGMGGAGWTGGQRAQNDRPGYRQNGQGNGRNFGQYGQGYGQNNGRQGFRQNVQPGVQGQGQRGQTWQNGSGTNAYRQGQQRGGIQSYNQGWQGQQPNRPRAYQNPGVQQGGSNYAPRQQYRAPQQYSAPQQQQFRAPQQFRGQQQQQQYRAPQQFRAPQQQYRAPQQYRSNPGQGYGQNRGNNQNRGNSQNHDRRHGG